ncbi:MAG: hypothetical protein HKN07_03540 [Acidimicrobiia bacterium]|nr:hypothetical protein [Acidimicrobiia bacterium]
MSFRTAVLVCAVTLSVAACTSADSSSTTLDVSNTFGVSTTGPAPTVATTTTVAPTTTLPPETTTTVPLFTLSGAVTTPSGEPLPGALVTVPGGVTVEVDDEGRFEIEGVAAGEVVVERPAWLSTSFSFTGEPPEPVAMEPRIVRALRVSKYVAMEPEEFAALIDLAATTVVNALVFDTKDETGEVLYETSVEEAHDLGAVNPMYDPVEALAAAKAEGLYTITRIVTFEDRIKSGLDAEAKLAGWWLDPVDEVNWEYPLALAVEACELGFDEVQFDYVRFPTGKAAAAASAKRSLSQEERVGAIASFLTEATETLHPLGCAVSADIFGIVLSSPTDEGIGQRPEELSRIVDALSPMIYPSHYSPGWLGFAEPNDHPGPVVSRALDDGWPRFEGPALMRPWLQAFYYSAAQIRTEIEVAEERGFGWILWNAGGSYARSALQEEEASNSTDG